jgi:hypothetical protein
LRIREVVTLLDLLIAYTNQQTCIDNETRGAVLQLLKNDKYK